MQGDNMSRKQFLAVLGSAAGALVLGRVAGLIGSTLSTSSIDSIKSADANAYGNFPYGGNKA